MTGTRKTKATPAKAESATKRATDGKILLVEDEEIVRSLARKLLENRGYLVLEAATLQEAREIWENEAGDIDLLLTDVQLADGSAKILAREFRGKKPHLPIVFASGYSADVIMDVKNDSRDTFFVQKPYHPRELMNLIESAFKKPHERS